MKALHTVFVNKHFRADRRTKRQCTKPVLLQWPGPIMHCLQGSSFN